MSDQIEIKIDGKRITPDKFLAAAEDFFRLVRGVAKNLSDVPINWAVEVDKGSAILRMRVENPSRDSENSLDAVRQGVRALRNRIARMPSGFTRTEIEAAKRLGRLADGHEVQFVTILNGGPPEDVPMSVAETADLILEGQSEMTFGSVEGIIVNLSARHGLSCTIDDPIQRREITCYLQQKQAQEEAHAGFNKRVLANGLIHYAKEGHPVSITVDSIRIFPPESELPSVEDIQAIYRQL